ncbi:MAG: class I SAM-dependent methyltransferase [Fibrobacterota bacterium]
MNEASKTRALFNEEELSLIRGKGIDIGSGKDPVCSSARCFDVEDGDANEITRYIDEKFDYVFSAHCLEHMKDPVSALSTWWELLQPGGHLVLIVPDEDLYEQGYWPSLFNKDHKATFTISKKKSWSPVSHNLIDMVSRLPGAEMVSIKVCENNYKRVLINHGFWPRFIAVPAALFTSALQYFANKTRVPSPAGVFSRLLRFPVDQTMGKALAQIQVIVRKNS